MKKKRLSARWLHKIAGNRFFLAMKLNFFLMFFVVLSASANIDVMSQRVNLDFKNTDLSTVFKSLESQTGSGTGGPNSGFHTIEGYRIETSLGGVIQRFAL